jgi:hypothetical protein
VVDVVHAAGCSAVSRDRECAGRRPPRAARVRRCAPGAARAAAQS